jgi:hypothetical protein
MTKSESLFDAFSQAGEIEYTSLESHQENLHKITVQLAADCSRIANSREFDPASKTLAFAAGMGGGLLSRECQAQLTAALRRAVEELDGLRRKLERNPAFPAWRAARRA